MSKLSAFDPSSVREDPPSRAGGTAWQTAVSIFCLLIPACDSSDRAQPEAPPRAITTMTVEAGRPRSETRVAAVVEPYRRSEIGVDVSGILTFVAEPGSDLRGPQRDGTGGLLPGPDGRAVQAGDVVARINATRYEQSVAAATLAIESLQKKREAKRVELDQVLSQRIENSKASLEASKADVVSAREAVTAAKAEFELARSNVDRDRRLIDSGAVAQSVLDSSESSYRAASAYLAQARSALDSALQGERAALASLGEAKGRVSVQSADIDTLDAQIAENRIALAQARTDLESCIVRAPFDGRVTATFTATGSYVAPGQAVVELTLLSPVKVILTASAEQERELPVGAGMNVYTIEGRSRGTPTVGTVFEKASVADPGTRTFRIGLIVPNYVLGAEDDRTRLASIHSLFPVLPAPDSPSGPLYVNTRCVFERGGQSFVQRLPAFSAEIADQRQTTQTPERVMVTLGQRWRQVDQWTLRDLESTTLQRGDSLVVNPVPDETRSIRIGAPRYSLRPGDVVEVGVTAALPPVGFWVPVDAIVSESGEKRVFAVREGAAHAIQVRVHEASGDQRRITGDAVVPGLEIAVQGVSYLVDGERVSISEDSSFEASK